MYLEWLGAPEASSLGHLARHSPWFFTLADLVHVLGAAFVVGGIAVFDIKVLVDHDGGDAWSVGRYAIPLAAAGVALQLPSRVCSCRRRPARWA